MIAKGTIVEVYEDPLTMMRKEGNAEIIRHVSDGSDGLSLYSVRFIGEGMDVQRWVAEKPLCCCFEKVGDNDQCPVHVKVSHV
jgi:hypothetical protein